MPRTPIEESYMKAAYIFANLSYAVRRKVGCVIVKDGQIISYGYNGTPHGFDNNCEEEDVIYYENPDIAYELEGYGYACQNGCCIKEGAKTKPEVLHAESNAIMKVAKSTMSCDGADLYTTTMPCFDCAKLIIQAGISKVYFTEGYRDKSGIELLQRAKIPVFKLKYKNNEH